MPVTNQLVNQPAGWWPLDLWKGSRCIVPQSNWSVCTSIKSLTHKNEISAVFTGTALWGGPNRCAKTAPDQARIRYENLSPHKVFTKETLSPANTLTWFPRHFGVVSNVFCKWRQVHSKQKPVFVKTHNIFIACFMALWIDGCRNDSYANNYFHYPRHEAPETELVKSALTLNMNWFQR